MLTRRRLARVSMVALAVLVVGLLGYQVRELREATRAACELYTDIGDPTLLSPQSSELGRTIVEDARLAAERLDCP